MPPELLPVEAVSRAVRHFWETGGDERRNAHFDKLAGVFAHEIDQQLGLYAATARKSTIVPGYFRATKSWDLLIRAAVDGPLLGVLEFKSVQRRGSPSANFNNRVEEALGSATDLWAARRAGLLGDRTTTPEPWVGYALFFPVSRSARRPWTRKPSVYAADPELEGSLLDKAQCTVTRLVERKLYSAASLTFVNRARPDEYSAPTPAVSLEALFSSLVHHMERTQDIWDPDGEHRRFMASFKKNATQRR